MTSELEIVVRRSCQSAKMCPFKLCAAVADEVAEAAEDSVQFMVAEHIEEAEEDIMAAEPLTVAEAEVPLEVVDSRVVVHVEVDVAVMAHIKIPTINCNKVVRYSRNKVSSFVW